MTAKLGLRNQRVRQFRKGDEPQSGVSLLEVLVAIVVVGLLLSLLLPAVSSARESARRTQCASHLRQIGGALASFESQYGRFPPGSTHKYRLLPFLDLAAVQQQAGSDPSDFVAFWSPLSGLRVDVYLCPTDSAPDQRATDDSTETGTSYAACFGSGSLKFGENGMFPARKTVRIRDVRDGLSNTVAVSEFLRGVGLMERLRTLWQTPVNSPHADQFEQLVDECDSLPIDPKSYGWLGATSRGFPWWYDDRGYGLYNHALTPNRPSCLNGTHVPTGLFTAGSAHPGGVNALYADGHVVFMSNHVDREIWRSAGSRDEELRNVN